MFFLKKIIEVYRQEGFNGILHRVQVRFYSTWKRARYSDLEFYVKDHSDTKQYISELSKSFLKGTDDTQSATIPSRHYHPDSLVELTNSQIINLIQERNREVSSLIQVITELKEVVHDRNDEISALYQSTSWRLTKPLRTLSLLLRGKREPKMAPARVGITSRPDVYHNTEISRETILVVSHDATRTGAPVLSLNLVQAFIEKYNVVVLLLGGGTLHSAFQLESTAVITSTNKSQINSVIHKICDRFKIKFALVNSIESCFVLPSLSYNSVPTISLIHEFASNTRPKHAFVEAYFWSGEIVFSTKMTQENALAEHPNLVNRLTHIIPQGRCIIPAENISKLQLEAERTRIRYLVRPVDCDKDEIVVLGAGTVNLRKGIDLFIECAARVVHAPGGNKCRFVWVGKGYDPVEDLYYSVYLADQITRSGLQGRILFIDETAAIETAYEEADIMLISSRLDPLPNVAIDAMLKGRPVVCFNLTTGIADFLNNIGLRNECVADYLDTADMAKKILTLAGSEKLRISVGKQCCEAAISFFNMKKYTDRLEVLAGGLCQRLQQEKLDIHTILDAGLFRRDFSSTRESQFQTIETVISRYARSWASGIGRRKPFPGFHPGIYQEQYGLVAQGVDPLADYLRRGRPEGPWNYPVIIAEESEVKDLPYSQRIALHLHVYYPELLPDIINRLLPNKICPDLFISINNNDVRKTVISCLKSYKGRVVDIQLVPNRGRDIGPLLTAFGQRILSDYDFVGHVHTKKTADIKDAAIGHVWYYFLLENLLGGKSGNMVDTIINRMNKDSSIGIVFPDDPNIIGWDANRNTALSLGDRLGLGNLSDNFNFPVGSMFWARTLALAPLVNLKFDWVDYPEEPLPYDGTLLHAIERLFPLIASATNLRSAVTNVTGLTR